MHPREEGQVAVNSLGSVMNPEGKCPAMLDACLLRQGMAPQFCEAPQGHGHPPV